jgi:hypothetical protein
MIGMPHISFIIETILMRVADRKCAAATLLERIHHLEEEMAFVKRKVEVLVGEDGAR